jgi:hypothetical protein
VYVNYSVLFVRGLFVTAVLWWRSVGILGIFNNQF